MDTSLIMARWIYDNYPYKDDLTHLKVQKLLFYCVGTAMAFDVDGPLGGEIVFQPWEHGPVNVPVWHQFKDYKGAAIPGDAFAGLDRMSFPELTEAPMMWALKIYGALDAWKLRQQSHLERPWLEAYENRQQRLSAASVRDHFRRKWLGKTVFAPEHLQDPGTFTIDGLPVFGYRSIQDLADSIHLIYGG